MSNSKIYSLEFFVKIALLTVIDFRVKPEKTSPTSIIDVFLGDDFSATITKPLLPFPYKPFKTMFVILIPEEAAVVVVVVPLESLLGLLSIFLKSTL